MGGRYLSLDERRGLVEACDAGLQLKLVFKDEWYCRQ